MAKYEIRPIIQKEVWEEFSLRSSPNTFLQSWNWGEFNKAIGREIWRLGLQKGSKLVGIALLVKHSSRLGGYLYCPRGPILNWNDTDAFRALFEEIKSIGQTENCIFIKIDPLLEETSENQAI